MFKLGAVIELPEFLGDDGSSLRWHNATVKKSIREQLEFHRVNRIKKHFEHSARVKYGYARRTSHYLDWKTRNRGKLVSLTNEHGIRVLAPLAADANLDLVRTGNTKRRVATQDYKITAGGSGATVKGTLTLKVPIPGSTGRSLSVGAALRLIQAGKIPKLTSRVAAESKMETNRRTINEIERFAADEITEISNAIALDYARAWNANRKRSRKVIKAT